MAVSLLKDCIARGISFNQETTLCGNSILNNIKRAKVAGYRVEMFYVGIKSAALAKERIAHRVTTGGHAISDTLVEQRYPESLQNLEQIYPYCDRLVLFDNSDSFMRVAVIEQSCIEQCNTVLPIWAKGIVDLAKKAPQNEIDRQIADALAYVNQLDAPTAAQALRQDTVENVPDEPER